MSRPKSLEAVCAPSHLSEQLGNGPLLSKRESSYRRDRSDRCAQSSRCLRLGQRVASCTCSARRQRSRSYRPSRPPLSRVSSSWLAYDLEPIATSPAAGQASGCPRTILKQAKAHQTPRHPGLARGRARACGAGLDRVRGGESAEPSSSASSSQRPSSSRSARARSRVAGTGFRLNEKLRLVADAPHKQVKDARADSTDTF